MPDGSVLVYEETSIGLFHYQGSARKFVVGLTQHWMFDHCILVLILIDAICQSIYDHADVNSVTAWNRNLNLLFFVTAVLFLLEATLRIIAYGFIRHRNAYLRDIWNVIDFAVVLTSFEVVLEIINRNRQAGRLVDAPSLKALRVLRVARPLRAIKRFPSMRRLVSIIVKAVPEMVTTLLFFGFFLVVISIVGLQLFAGELHSRCRETPEPVNSTHWRIDPAQASKICSKAATAAGRTDAEYRIRHAH